MDKSEHPHSIGVGSDGFLSLKLFEEKGEFGETSASTLLWDTGLIHRLIGKSFYLFSNNARLKRSERNASDNKILRNESRTNIAHLH